MTGITLDTGALIALESGDPFVVALVEEAKRKKAALAVPAGVLAQAWRGGNRQVRIVRLIRASVTDVVPLDNKSALAVGELCARTGTSDVIDASVVTCARARKHRVVTSDPTHIRALDPRVEIVALS